MTREQLRRPQAARFEYRVWGTHRHARKLLGKLTDDQSSEQTDDCYLLVDDTSWNAKIRNDTLKIKRLVAQRKGFEQWVSDRHDHVDTVPSPFDTIFDRLGLDRLQHGDAYDLPGAIAALGPGPGVRAVFVTKQRRHYRIGELRAEATDITIHETTEVLHTLSIEGDDLARLRALRKRLGLCGHANVAVHNALHGHRTTAR
jgi:hypothetical protein